jgi:putative sterol carrier protein
VDAKAGANAVGSVSVANDPAGAKADCEITISDADLLALATGKLNAMSAYMSGKLKVKGKSTLAQKLGELLKKAPEPKSKL